VMPYDWRTKPLVEARCLDCDKHWGGKNGHGVGAQHAKRYGHKVYIDVTITYVYGDPGGPK